MKEFNVFKFLKKKIQIPGKLLFKFLSSPASIQNVRPMLTAIVQMAATILAIVITLSLVAVQLTASSYSPRVIEIFIKSPFLWVMVISYILLISYSLGLLKIISKASILSNQKKHVNIAYFSSLFCLLILIPYTLNTISLLRPSTIIKRFSRKITKENLIKERKEDPIQPIIDIVCGSITRYDYETARDGLSTVGNKVYDILQKEKFNKNEEEKVTRKVCNHFVRLGRLAISKDDEYSTIAVIINIKKIGEISVEKELKYAPSIAAWSLRKVGEAITEKDFEDAIWWAIESLREIGKAAGKRKLEGAVKSAAWSLGEVGKAAAKRELKEAASKTGWSLKEIGEIATEKELEGTARWIVEYLQEMGIAVAEKGLEEVAKKITDNLNAIGRAAKDKGFSKETISKIDNAVKEINEAIKRSKRTKR